MAVFFRLNTRMSVEANRHRRATDSIVNGAALEKVISNGVSSTKYNGKLEEFVRLISSEEVVTNDIAGLVTARDIAPIIMTITTDRRNVKMSLT